MFLINYFVNIITKMYFLRSFSFWSLIKVFILGVSSYAIFVLSGKKDIDEKPLYFSPPTVLKHFSLGYNDFVADMLWLRFLQNSDFCSFEKGIPVYKGDKKTCKMGWSYRMTDTITELAPRFKTPYVVSAIVMNVFAGDIEGSEQIILKGLKYFPDDLKINMYATYLYSTDIPKPDLAARYAYQVAKNGGPYWYYSFAARQHMVAGRVELGETLLTNLLEEEEFTDEQKQKIREHLQRMKGELGEKKRQPAKEVSKD